MPHDHVVNPIQWTSEDLAERCHTWSGASGRRSLRPWGVSRDDVQETVSEQKLNLPPPRACPDDEWENADVLTRFLHLLCVQEHLVSHCVVAPPINARAASARGQGLQIKRGTGGWGQLRGSWRWREI